MQRVGHPVSRYQIILKANEINQAIHRNTRQLKNLGEGWYKRFIARHDDVLANREAQVINRSQNEVSKEGIHILFWTMTKLTITEQLTADREYNMDETGFQTHEKRRKVVAVRGSKNVWTKSISADFHLSLVAACSASGHIAPPTFILPGSRVKRDVLNNCAVKGTTVSTTESGFINEKIFFQWIQKFSQCIPSTVAYCTNIRWIQRTRVVECRYESFRATNSTCLSTTKRYASTSTARC
jgi:hypothetical protein